MITYAEFTKEFPGTSIRVYDYFCLGYYRGQKDRITKQLKRLKGKGLDDKDK